MDGLSPRRRTAVLVVLTAALALSYADRYLLAVLVEPIRAEFGLSDGQLGILTGIAFSLFYATLAVPLGRIADRGRHRAVIAGSILTWSLVTALTAAVQSFLQMAVARFGVGAGEAGVFPTAQAVLAEVYPPERRTGAMALFASGGSIGLMIAFIAGAWIEGHLGWRGTFFVMAAPGLLLAPVAFFVLRGVYERKLAATEQGFLPDLWRNGHFRHLPLAQSAVVILLFGQIQWLPAFFERSFQIDRVTIGATLGLTQGFATIGGAILGGILSDRRRGSDPRWPLKLSRYCIVAALMPTLLLYSYAGPNLAYGLAAGSAFLVSMSTGPIAAHLQFVVRRDQRAGAAALALMIASILGLGLGPVAIGSLSDLLRPTSGELSLAHALLVVMALATCWAAWHLGRLDRLEHSSLAETPDAAPEAA